ncbi:MAG: nucleoside hydrolase [Anaerolineae bacterium]|nr:nucleoside hydrolase [Anaerolineae bacterium]
MTKRILIDADPGIDDALAILLALASPELNLEGITIVPGNCSSQDGSRNARKVLQLAGASQIPVARGVERPLVQPLVIASETHGPTGLGYAKTPEPTQAEDARHGVDFLIEQAMSAPGEYTLVAIGPLTNLALALRREPRLATAFAQVIHMGGAIHTSGNVTPQAEFNVWCDPHATHMVYHAGLPLTVVPLDVTYQCVLMQKHVDHLLQFKSPVSRFIAGTTRFYIEFHNEYQDIDGCIINDPLALALAFAPELVTCQEIFVDVDIAGGVSMGKTFGYFYKMGQGAPNAQVALAVKPEVFLDLFVDRMEVLCRKYPD